MSEFNRRALYKNSDRDFETQRRNRNDHSVEIRKAKKEDQLQKRRNIEIDDLSDVGSPTKENVKPSVLTSDEILKMLASNNLAQMIEAATSCRKQLSKVNNPPIEEFFKNGAIPLLVKMLSNYKDDVLIFESAWALTNIASGETKHTEAVVEAGAIKFFINLVGNSNDQISEQSLWALANITGDCAAYRDKVIKQGIIPVLKVALVRFWDKLEILRQICWLISNIFRHKSKNYPTASVIEMLPLVREIMTKKSDVVCKTDLTWALTYACDCREEIINAIIELDILQLVVNNLANETELVVPSLRSVGNVIAGTNEQADAAIKCGVIDVVGPLLKHKHLRVVKECCWLFSNISAGTDEQVTALVNSGYMIAVLDVLKNGDYKSQKEAAWTVSNMISSQNDNHKYYLLNNQIFDAIMPLLVCEDKVVLNILLDSIRELFRCADEIGQLEQCVAVFEAVHGVEAIEHLQTHASDDIYQKSYDIIREYLNGGDDEDEQDDKEGLEKYNF